MALISIISTILLAIGCQVQELFLFAGIATLIVSVYICRTLPDALLRSILQFIFALCFRVRITGLDNFKNANKNTIIIANHSSLLDALLLAAYLPEKLTFAINSEWSKKWFIRAFSSLFELYPIDPTNPMAVRGLIEEAKKGKKMVILPEGRITVTGGLMKIYEGAAVVADKAGAALLPVRIDGAHISISLPVVWILPIVLFVVLLGLGLDYEIFITTRVRENRVRGMSNDDAIDAAITSASGTISLCALIMGGTFCTLLVGSSSMVQEFGFALGIGIFIDGLFMVTYVGPALMHLLGEMSWKGPAFLQKKQKDQ